MPALVLALAVAASGTPSTLSISLLKKLDGVRPLAFAPAPIGSKVAITMENNEVRIFDAATRQTLKVLKGHPQPPYAVAWSNDGTFIATGDESARIFIWNALTGERSKTIIGHIRGIQKLSFNHPRTLLASTGKDDVINVWNVSNGKKVAQILGKGANLYSGTFHPLSDNLLAGTLSGGARIYRITGSGAQVANYLSFTNPGGQSHGVLDANWNSAGTRAITAANDNSAILWDTKTFKRLGSFRGHQDWVVRSEFSPNGRYVATSSSDRTVKLWETTSFKKVADLTDQGAVGAPLCFTADGRFLLSTNVDDSLEVFAITPSQGGAAAAKPAPKKKKKG